MNIVPARGSRIVLAVIPFFLIALIYVVGSAERRAANPDDKLLPSVTEMVETVQRLAAEPDRRSGDYVLWTDTAASMRRLALGLGISTLIGLAFGLTIGLLPLAGAALGTIVAVISMIPPMAILPILFIVFGLGELSKVVLIVIGVAPFLIRDQALAVASLPREQMIKAQTLGASTWHVAIRVVLPQHLRTLARVGEEVTLEVDGPITQRAILDALEARHPVLRGTIRDQVTQQRRPFLRFFACEEDWSHELPDAPLPGKVASGAEPFLVVGAMAGG